MKNLKSLKWDVISTNVIRTLYTFESLS